MAVSLFDSSVTASTAGVAWVGTTNPSISGGDTVEVVDGSDASQRVNQVIDPAYIESGATAYLAYIRMLSPAHLALPRRLTLRTDASVSSSGDSSGPQLTDDAEANLGLAIQAGGSTFKIRISDYTSSDSIEPYTWNVGNNITQTIIDNIGGASSARSILVDISNSAIDWDNLQTVDDLSPSLESVDDQNAVYRIAYSLILPEATGGDGTLTYSVSGLPSGLTFTASTRTISGTPTGTGTSEVTYTVTDEDSDTDSVTFDIEVVSEISLFDAFVTEDTVGVAAKGTTNPTYVVGTGLATLVNGSNSGTQLDSQIDSTWIANGSTAYLTGFSFDGTNGSMGVGNTPGGHPTQIVDDGFTSNARSRLGIAVRNEDGDTYKWTLAGLLSSDLTDPYTFTSLQMSQAGSGSSLALRQNVGQADELTIIIVDRNHKDIDWDNLRFNPTPSVSSISDVELEHGGTLNETLPAGSGDQTPLTYSVSGLASWMSFDTSTRELTGTAPNEQSTTEVTYTVTDNDGDTATTTFNVIVLLGLADFDAPSGNTLLSRALIDADDSSSSWYWEAQSDGDLLDGSLQPRTFDFVRIRFRANVDQFQLNDDSSVNIEDYFSSGGDGYDLSIHIQDMEGVASFAVAEEAILAVSDSSTARWDAPTDFLTILDRIQSDRGRFILAFTEPGPTEVVASYTLANITATATVEQNEPEATEISASHTLQNTTASASVETMLPLLLTDFVVPAGHEEVDVALITSGRDSQNFFYRADTAVGTLEDGSLELESGTVITRIRDRNPNRFLLNDSPDADDITAFFNTGGNGNDITIHIQDDAGVASIVAADTINVGVSHADAVQFNTPAAFDTIVNRIANGDRFILAFTRPQAIADTEVTASHTLQNVTADATITRVEPEGIEVSATHTLQNVSASAAVETTDPLGAGEISAEHTLQNVTASAMVTTSGAPAGTDVVAEHTLQNVTASVVVTAAVASEDLEISEISDIEIEQLETRTVTLPAATGGSTPITYTLTGTTDWMDFDASNRELTLTALAASSETDLTYTATDDDGETATRTFTVDVLFGYGNFVVPGGHEVHLLMLISAGEPTGINFVEFNSLTSVGEVLEDSNPAFDDRVLENGDLRVTRVRYVLTNLLIINRPGAADGGTGAFRDHFPEVGDDFYDSTWHVQTPTGTVQFTMHDPDELSTVGNGFITLGPGSNADTDVMRGIPVGGRFLLGLTLPFGGFDLTATPAITGDVSVVASITQVSPEPQSVTAAISFTGDVSVDADVDQPEGQGTTVGHSIEGVLRVTGVNITQTDPGSQDITASPSFTGDISVDADVTQSDPIPPGRPAAPFVGSNSSDSIQVIWSPPAILGAGVDTYDLRYREEGTVPWAEVTDILLTSRTISGLQGDTEYEVQIRAENIGGVSGWSPSGMGSTLRNLTFNLGSYRLEADWNRNGQYDHAMSDLFNFMVQMSIHTKRGRDYGTQIFGRSVAGNLTVTLRNEGDEFDRFNSNSLLFGYTIIGTPIRLLMEDIDRTGVYHYLWSGSIDKTDFKQKRGGQDEITIVCKDIIIELQLTEASAPARSSITTENAARILLNAGGISDDKIGNIEGEFTMEHWWSERQPILRSLRELEETEGGFFWVDQENRVTFESSTKRDRADARTPKLILIDNE